jgi:hypothetical protein
LQLLRDKTDRPRETVDQQEEPLRSSCSIALLCSKRSMVLVDCLGRLNKPFLHFFLVGEQLLDTRALLHAFEMRHDAGEA